jgi:2-dehydro-3-deoxygalactonokinase
MTAFIGVDWGTTNLRAWRIDGHGKIQDTVELPHGVSQLSPGEAPVLFERQVHRPLGSDLPVLMCGMVGSNLGWRAIDYVACPADRSTLAAGVASVRARPPIRIVPGLRCAGIKAASDIMRGEETQILGWIETASTHARGRHIICLPGTHSKWAIVRDGAVERFVTAMTGELFHVLRTHSILAAGTSGFDAAAFAAGVDAAGDGGGLSIRIFSARTRQVADGAAPAETASYLSGLLIGSEIASISSLLDCSAADPITLIAAPVLRERYASALAQRSWSSVWMDGVEAAVAGLQALVRQGVLHDA